MDAPVENLKYTTLSGRRFTRRQIDDIQETATTILPLSRKQLASTICEHLNQRPLVADRLQDLRPLRLQVVHPDQAGLWREFVERRHYIACRQPQGPHFAMRMPLERCGGMES